MGKQQPFLAFKSFLCGGLIFVLFFCLIGLAVAQSKNIKNDTFWDTKNGKPVYSQGGGIYKFADPETGVEKYYWYGVHYKQAETYRENPSVTQERNNFEGVNCYTSTDLINWEFEANVLTPEEVFKDSGGRRGGWLGRMGVAYVKEANKYVLIKQYGSRVLFANADSPLGPFTKSHVKSMEDWIGTTNSLSPVLNHANIQEERKLVIGERSLKMSDRVGFVRQTHQKIDSSPYVKFEDGNYTLTAKVKNSENFNKLEMYAKSGERRFKVSFKEGNETWKTISIENVEVKNNEVEIGFLADGKGGHLPWLTMLLW